MKLNAEYRTTVVHDSLVGPVVLVGEEDRPVFRQCGGFKRKAVILGGDEAALGGGVGTGLIVTSVSIPEAWGGAFL